MIRKTFISVAMVSVLQLGIFNGVSHAQGFNHSENPETRAKEIATKYKSCSLLLKDYPNGVAKNKATASKMAREGFARPAVSGKLYKKYGKRLDRDKDGVICEKPL